MSVEAGSDGADSAPKRYAASVEAKILDLNKKAAILDQRSVMGIFKLTDIRLVN